MKPTTDARSMVRKEIAFPRSFSATAQKMWPPSRGRNGNRLMIASESEIRPKIDMTVWKLEVLITCREVS